jgi:hypothetical protein
MVKLSDSRCRCISILWVSLVSFAAITLCVASLRVLIVVNIYFVLDLVRKLLDTPSYINEYIMCPVRRHESNSSFRTFSKLAFKIIQANQDKNGSTWFIVVLRLSRRWCFKSRSSDLWRRVMLWYYTNVSEDHAVSIFRVKRRWRHHGPLKRWYPTTTLHGVIA